jgi:hypothetical protein
VGCSGRWRSWWSAAPSGARWGCCAEACTMGSRWGEPARSQAVLHASIALIAARRRVPYAAGPHTGDCGVNDEVVKQREIEHGPVPFESRTVRMARSGSVPRRSIGNAPRPAALPTATAGEGTGKSLASAPWAR